MARGAGFEVLPIVPGSRTEDLMALTEDIHTQARRVYPRVEVNDLVSRIVRVALRRPE